MAGPYQYPGHLPGAPPPPQPVPGYPPPHGGITFVPHHPMMAPPVQVPQTQYPTAPPYAPSSPYAGTAGGGLPMTYNVPQIPRPPNSYWARWSSAPAVSAPNMTVPPLYTGPPSNQPVHQVTSSSSSSASSPSLSSSLLETPPNHKNPQPPTVMYQGQSQGANPVSPTDAPATQMQKDLYQAKANWNCKVCRRLNRPEQVSCGNCFAPKVGNVQSSQTGSTNTRPKSPSSPDDSAATQEDIYRRFSRMLGNYGPMEATGEKVLNMFIQLSTFERKLVMAQGSIKAFLSQCPYISVVGNMISLAQPCPPGNEMSPAAVPNEDKPDLSCNQSVQVEDTIAVQAEDMSFAERASSHGIMVVAPDSSTRSMVTREDSLDSEPSAEELLAPYKQSDAYSVQGQSEPWSIGDKVESIGSDANDSNNNKDGDTSALGQLVNSYTEDTGQTNGEKEGQSESTTTQILSDATQQVQQKCPETSESNSSTDRPEQDKATDVEEAPNSDSGIRVKDTEGTTGHSTMLSVNSPVFKPKLKIPPPSEGVPYSPEPSPLSKSLLSAESPVFLPRTGSATSLPTDLEQSTLHHKGTTTAEKNTRVETTELSPVKKETRNVATETKKKKVPTATLR